MGKRLWARLKVCSLQQIGWRLKNEDMNGSDGDFHNGFSHRLLSFFNYKAIISHTTCAYFWNRLLSQTQF